MDASHSNLNIWSILLVGACVLAPAGAQTTKPLATPWMTVPPQPAISPVPSKPAASPKVSRNTAPFRDLKLSKSAPEPPPALQQVTAQLSGTLVGQVPNASIRFVLFLRNDGPQEIKILDPLDSFFLLFATKEDKLIRVPDRISKLAINTSRDKKDMPFPAPV